LRTLIDAELLDFKYMRKSKKYSTKRITKIKSFLFPKTKVSSWKMLATRLEHRRVEGKGRKRKT